jgi:phage-related minor tail protein
MIAQVFILTTIKAGMTAFGVAASDTFDGRGSFKQGAMGEAGPEATLPLKRCADDWDSSQGASR